MQMSEECKYSQSKFKTRHHVTIKSTKHDDNQCLRQYVLSHHDNYMMWTLFSLLYEVSVILTVNLLFFLLPGTCSALQPG